MAQSTPQIWPAASAPIISIVSINGISVPTDPHGNLTFSAQDVTLQTASTYQVVLEAKNVPTDETWSVKLRFVDCYTGKDTFVNATWQSGTLADSLWTASVTMDKGFTALQARAYQGTTTSSSAALEKQVVNKEMLTPVEKHISSKE